MKILKGSYIKEDVEERIEVLVLNDSPEYIKGIAMHKLDDVQKEELKNIQLEYEKKLQPYMTSFRQYKREKLTGEFVK